MSLGWEEDGIIEEEMIELCGSSDINDLILYCRSLKQDCVKHITEVKRLRGAIADIANNMEAADESYMSGFIEDLRKVIE